MDTQATEGTSPRRGNGRRALSQREIALLGKPRRAAKGARASRQAKTIAVERGPESECPAPAEVAAATAPVYEPPAPAAAEHDDPVATIDALVAVEDDPWSEPSPIEVLPELMAVPDEVATTAEVMPEPVPAPPTAAVVEVEDPDAVPTPPPAVAPWDAAHAAPGQGTSPATSLDAATAWSPSPWLAEWDGGAVSDRASEVAPPEPEPPPAVSVSEPATHGRGAATMSAFERLFGPTEPFAAAGASRPDTEAIDVLLEATDSEPPSAHPADHDRVDSAAPDWSMSEATAGVLAEPPAQSTSSVLSRDGTLAFDTVILAVTGLALLAWALANLATGASAKVTVLGVVAANLAFAAALLRRSSAA